jgi:hypothetical protein
VTSRYQPLLDLARRERELVQGGRWDELGELGAQWAAQTAALSEPTPADRELLEEIAAIVWSTVAAVQSALASTTRVLDHVQRGRLAVDSYVAETRLAALDTRG